MNTIFIWKQMLYNLQNIRVVKEVPLEENLNRFMAETTVAETVEEAISVLR